jgi:uncharacterized protein YjbI with pentapeptide repeats
MNTAIELLQAGKVQEFNQFRADNPDFIPDLRGIDLYLNKRTVKYAKLKGINFKDALLQGSNLQGAKLQGALLQGANLQDANLYRTNLCMVNLQGANLQGVNLNRALLQGARFDKSQIAMLLELLGIKIIKDKQWLSELLRIKITEDKQ